MTIAARIRAWISAAEIGRLSSPRRRDASLDELRDERVRLAPGAVVAIPAGARLAPEATGLAQAVRHVDVAFARVAHRRETLAPRPGDVEARQVRHRERSHRKPERLERRVHVLGQGAFLQDVFGLLAVARQDAVAHEPVADAAHDGDLAETLRDREPGCDDVRRRILGPDDLDELHHVGGAEEVQPDHVGRPARRGGDEPDVEIARVGREHRSRGQDGVEIAEQGLLDLQVLVHRLDHEIPVGERRELAVERDRVPPLRGRRCAEPTGGDEPLVDLRDPRPTGRESLLARLDDAHREAGVREGDRDTRSHRARAHDADRAHRTRGHVLEPGTRQTSRSAKKAWRRAAD